MQTNKDTILQLENAINVVIAAINVTNSFYKKKEWRHKRNEMTKDEVVSCLRKQILKLKESDTES